MTTRRDEISWHLDDRVSAQMYTRAYHCELHNLFIGVNCIVIVTKKRKDEKTKKECAYAQRRSRRWRRRRSKERARCILISSSWLQDTNFDFRLRLASYEIFYKSVTNRHSIVLFRLILWNGILYYLFALII